MPSDHNTTTRPRPTRFEEQLLSDILENFDELVADVNAGIDRSLAGTHQAPVTGRRWRARSAWAVPTAAAALTVGLVLGAGHGRTAPQVITPPVSVVSTQGTKTHVRRSSRHELLYRLAAKSFALAPITGRYVIQSQTDTETDEPGYAVKLTVVDDTSTGASTTYQTHDRFNPQAPQVSAEPADPAQTTAYYGSLPTDPTQLRASLLTAAKQAWARYHTFFDNSRDEQGYKAPASTSPTPSDDDFVYQQASDLLWSPTVPPALRSALLQVLAGCAGVAVDQNATDPAGQPAIEISRADGAFGNSSTYEDPGTGAVLAQSYTVADVTHTTVYQPATGSQSIPSSPYNG